MNLTDKEKRMLAGECGEAVRQAMEILVAMGGCYGAANMLPVKSVHLLYNVGMIGRGGVGYLQGLAARGAHYAVYADTNPSSIPLRDWREYGISEDIARLQKKMAQTLIDMGAVLTDTCTPYFTGIVPRMGEHLAWNESSAVIYANSVLGARTNREGGPTALASALTALTPAYGYHLSGNRLGNLIIRVTARLDEPHDYGTLGFFTGRIARDRVPVFIGLPPGPSLDALKYLSAALASTGSVTLFHAVGITPEAVTEEMAFGGGGQAGRLDTFKFGEREKVESEFLLSKGSIRDIDFVTIGCPLASPIELQQIAGLLNGKRIKPDVQLWVTTSEATRVIALRMGWIKQIEASGAKVASGMCAGSIYINFLKDQGYRTLVTNSAKMANQAAMGMGLKPAYGSIARCVTAAISGRWV